MRRNKYLWILLTALLFAAVLVHVPVHASPESVRVYVKMPAEGYISGKDVNTVFDIDIYIESPPKWDNTTDGIIGWSLHVKVDPSVLEPQTVKGATDGYFLYNFTDYYEYYGHEPNLIKKINKTEGHSDISESIMGWGTLGLGAGGSGKLCALTVKSLSKTAYSLIYLFKAYYYNATGGTFPVEVVDDGHYNQPPTAAPPVAQFRWTPLKPISYEDVTFDASASYDPDVTNDIVSYRWDFGDGTTPVTKTTPIVTHDYIHGTYAVNLTVTDNEDVTNSIVKSIMVRNWAPTADFAYSPWPPIVGETVTFNASDSYDPDGTIVSYLWDFGDETNGTGEITTHIYASAGSYLVNLIVTDDDDVNGTTEKTVTIYTHDVAVSGIIPITDHYIAEVYPGWVINVRVTVKNEGNFTETFDVTLYYGATTIGTKTVTNLVPSASVNVTFSWDTTGLTPSLKIMTKGEASIVPGENDTADNSLSKLIKVKLVGDVDGSGKVDFRDLFALAAAYGSKPGDPNWNQQCDFDQTDKIDFRDLFALAANYGTTYDC